MADSGVPVLNGSNQTILIDNDTGSNSAGQTVFRQKAMIVDRNNVVLAFEADGSVPMTIKSSNVALSGGTSGTTNKAAYPSLIAQANPFIVTDGATIVKTFSNVLLSNIGSATLYLRAYDKATAVVNIGTDIPLFSIPLPPNGPPVSLPLSNVTNGLVFAWTLVSLLPSDTAFATTNLNQLQAWFR